MRLIQVCVCVCVYVWCVCGGDGVCVCVCVGGGGGGGGGRGGLRVSLSCGGQGVVAIPPLIATSHEGGCLQAWTLMHCETSPTRSTG